MKTVHCSSCFCMSNDVTVSVSNWSFWDPGDPLTPWCSLSWGFPKVSSAQGGLVLPSVFSARVHSCQNKNSLSDYSEWKGEGCDKALPIKGRPEDTGAYAECRCPSSCTYHVVNVRQYHGNPGSIHSWPHCRRMLLFVWRRNDRCQPLLTSL